MICPRCNQWADVQETKTSPDNTKRRRYVCANEHRFTTIEEVVQRTKPQSRVLADRANKSQED